MYKDWKGEKEVICHSIWHWRQQVGVHSSTPPSFHLFGPSSPSSNRWKNMTTYVQTGQGSLDATAETLFVMSPWKVNSFICVNKPNTEPDVYDSKVEGQIVSSYWFLFQKSRLPQSLKSVSRIRQNLNYSKRLSFGWNYAGIRLIARKKYQKTKLILHQVSSLIRATLPDFTHLVRNINRKKNILFLDSTLPCQYKQYKAQLVVRWPDCWSQSRLYIFLLTLSHHSASIAAVSTDAPASCCYQLLVKIGETGENYLLHNSLKKNSSGVAERDTSYTYSVFEDVKLSHEAYLSVQSLTFMTDALFVPETKSQKTRTKKPL